jgi:hypothetical protein
MDTCPLYAFEIAVHARPPEVRPGPQLVDRWGHWPTLTVAHEHLARPMQIDFDVFLSRLATYERMYVEPDGSFVWVSPREGLSWQVDGNAFDREGRLLSVDLKGSAPPTAFDRLLAALGWPGQPVVVQLVRAAALLEESVFREHARTRGSLGDGQSLRPR